MSRVEYNKLIRDKIKDKIESNGDSCEVKILEGAEFKSALLEKIVEEATELSKIETREEFLEEYADLMVVLDTLTNFYELSEADIKLALAESLEKKGMFKNKHFLLWSQYNK